MARIGLTGADQLVRPSEAAKLLAVSRRSLRRFELNGRLKALKLNPRITRYRLGDVLRLAGKEVVS
jgi:predicted site-specific integrase-resolvase